VGKVVVQYSCQVRCRRVRRINMTLGIRVKGEYSMSCLAAIIERLVLKRWRWIALARGGGTSMLSMGEERSAIDKDDA
jgi:hypothetical protein